MRDAQVLADRRRVADDDDVLRRGAPSSSGLTLMIDGPADAAASLSGSGGGVCVAASSAAAGAATFGVVTTTSAGMRNGLSRSAMAPAMATRQSAASPRAERPGSQTGAAASRPGSAPLQVLARAGVRSRLVAAIGSRSEPASFGDGPDSKTAGTMTVPAATQNAHRQPVPVSGPPQALLVEHGLVRVRREGRIGLLAAQQLVARR